MNTKGGEGGGSIKESALIEALRENWNHARHQENQRIYSLYIHGAIFAGVIYIWYYVRWNLPLGMSVLFFLAFFTVVIYCATLKWNAAIGNHMAAVRSISVKLGLIKEMEKSERCELEKRLRKTSIPEYAFIKEAYMGLPLPLFIRVHIRLEIYYSIVIGISLIFAIVAAFSRFSSILAINHLKLVIEVIVSIVSIITFFVLWPIRRRMKYEARVFKDMREPKEIKKRKNREGRLRKDEKKIAEEVLREVRKYVW